MNCTLCQVLAGITELCDCNVRKRILSHCHLWNDYKSSHQCNCMCTELFSFLLAASKPMQFFQVVGMFSDCLLLIWPDSILLHLRKYMYVYLFFILEPNLVTHTAHSLARKGIKSKDLDDSDLREVASPLMLHVRQSHLLASNSEVNFQSHWLKFYLFRLKKSFNVLKHVHFVHASEVGSPHWIPKKISASVNFIIQESWISGIWVPKQGKHPYSKLIGAIWLYDVFMS